MASPRLVVGSIRGAVAALGFILIFTDALPVAAAGINAARLSLPKGPGSVEGLGRTFEASPASGTASYGVDIAVPPAIGGFGPALSLVYDGGIGATEVGLGWSLGGLPRIRRRTEDGLPRFDATDHFELVGFGSVPELVEVSAGIYRFKHETGAFVCAQRSGDGAFWEARSKDGTSYRFGGEGHTESEGTNVATYLLSEQLDLHGHRIAYTWNTEGGWARLAKVTWNDLSEDARLEIALAYEPRLDVQTKFWSGIRQTLVDRLTTITVTRGAELVRRYDLAYSSDRHSRLANIRMLGADGRTGMPTLSFEYTAMQLGPSTDVIEMASPPGYSPANPNVALTDLDGDGLPDLLVAQTEQYRTYVNHDGKRWQDAQNWPAATWVSASLEETGVQLADMDGDGATDLIVKSGIDSLRYLPGATPTSFGKTVEVKTVPNFTFEDPDVRLADLDGDRRTDVMVTTSTGLAISYNLSGADWTQPVVVGAVDPTQPVRFSDGHTSLCDINGDRVQDICYLRSGGLAYWLGRGRGKFEPPVIATGVPLFDDSDPWKLHDLDGDGWLDLVHVGVSNVSFALATAIGEFELPTVIPNTPTKSPTSHVEFADMNGSGTTDIVWIDVSNGPAKAWQYLELFPKGRAGLLSKIDNGLGRVTYIEFAPASLFAAKAREANKPWQTRLNVPMPVVAKVTTDSSLGDPLLVSTIEYGNGTWDPKERTLAGFGGSIERLLGDASTPTLVTKSTYDTGLIHRVLRGLPTEITKQEESGYVFSRVIPSYLTRTLATALDGTPVEYGYKASERRTIIEGKDESRARTTQVDWKYDDYGNVLQEANWGEVADGDVLAGNDEVIVNRSYANLESDWILGRVASTETRDAKGTLLSLRRQYYDGEPYVGLPLGQVARGDLRRVESWIAGDRFANEVAYSHDAHGNVVVSIDGKGSRSELFYDENQQFLVREVRHVDTTTSLEWKATYDGRFGVITSLVDPNGHETRARYDDFGRVVSITKPGDSDERPTLSFERIVASPLSTVITHAREQSGTDNTLDSVELVDGLGRKRASFAEGSQPGRWIVSGFSRMDARGNAGFTAYANEVASATLPASVDGLSGTTSIRDALGRIVAVRHPDGAEARNEYAPFSETTWDENDSDPASPHYGTPTTTLHDGLGRVCSVIERDEGREITTAQYSYDGLGNLLGIVDALGRQRTYAYDGRSRRTVINDPNAGTWTMTYTDGNDLESRAGQDGGRISFLYDSLGRAIEERHSSPTVPERVAARFHYDNPSPEHPEHANTLGQLAWVEDDAGAKYFGYDSRGRLTDSTRKWFDGVEHHDWTDYDAQERMVRRGFPDRTHLTVAYDSRGLLSSMGALATQLQWSADGKLSSVTLGNGITDVHGYDARRRLTSMSATDSTGTLVRGFSLGLDAASRVTSITDLRPNVPAEESMTASFLYDSRYRLRQASYAAGQTTWELDALAKIAKVTSTFAEPHLNVTNTYGADSGVGAGSGVGPDQLIRHGDEVLVYDSAGRVLSDGERQLSWDAKGRLARAVRTGVTEEYVYGYDNNRALKKTTKADGSVELTRYIAEDIEERNGNLIRYAFLGEQRLARLDPVDAGKRVAPVTKTLARTDSGTDSSGRLASGAGSGVFSQANALRGLWVVCAGTLLSLACLLWFLWRSRKDRRLYWSATGASSFALAAMVFVACGSGGERLSVTERLRAESVEITTVPEGAEFYLPDAQVTPLAVTKANGQVRSHSLYHAYGQVRAQSGEHTDPFGYVGNEEDRGSGLSDFNARPYRPEIGIFYAVDPLALFEPEKTIGVPARLLAYAYAGGDPINNSDPSGLVAWGEVARGLGAQALDVAKDAAQAVAQQAKSDIAMLSEGRIADFAKSMLIDRSPIVAGAQGLTALMEGVASLPDDINKVLNASSDYEAGRLALKPLLTVVSVGATVAGAAGAGKALMGRGVRPKVPIKRGGGACGGNCGTLISCFVAGTLVASSGDFVPIEQLRLGDRVEAGNSACDADRWPNDALAVSLEMPHPKEPESTLRIELVRPVNWLRTMGIEAEGANAWLDLSEVGAAGWATVTGISEPPAISPGPGCLVLMTVQHVASELLRITLANGAAPLVSTPGHRLYVEGRGWTTARDVVDGDVLRGDSGPADVKAVESVEAGRAVYNIEVAREHTYRVSTARVWAHNQCPQGSGGGQSPKITPEHLRGKSPAELRQYATEQGLLPHATRPDKFMDPASGKERLRIDSGHIDPRTGLPYSDPKAAVPHAHGYEPDGKTKIRDPSDGNPHFPTR